MFKQTVLILFWILSSSSLAFSVDWCAHPETQLCITYENGGSDPTDTSVNAQTITNDGVDMETGSSPAAYSTYYGSYVEANSDKMTIADGGFLDFDDATEDFSGCLWINLSSVGGNEWVYNYGDGNDDQWRLLNLGSTSKMWFSIDAIDSKATDNTNTGWSHQCFTADRSGNATMYQEGVANGTTALNNEAMATTATTFYIANDSGGAQRFDGDMDEHIIGAWVFTSTDINDMMDNGLDNPTDTNWCGDANNVACYLMEDSGSESNESDNGSTAIAESGGTIPQDADAKFGTYSRDFEAGDTEYLTHANGNETDISGADQEISIVAWIKPESVTSNKAIVSKYNTGTGNRQYNLWQADSQADAISLCLSASSASGASADCAYGDTTLSSGTWWHVAVVYNDVDMRIYVNGVLDGTPVAKTDGIYNGTAPFLIGDREGSSIPYDGLLDDVGIFDKALTSVEINSIMESGLYQSAAGGRTRRFFIIN